MPTSVFGFGSVFCLVVDMFLSVKMVWKSYFGRPLTHGRPVITLGEEWEGG